MQEEKGNQIPVSSGALVPEIYMPRLQFFIRILLESWRRYILIIFQFHCLFLTITQINLVIVSFLVFHSFGWWYYKRYGAKKIMIRLSSWMDICAAAFGIFTDPFVIPPMLLLFLIAVLGNGIQHGLYVVIESMIGAFIFGIAALVTHSVLFGDWPPYNLYFYVFLIVVGVCYSYLLVRRIELMKSEVTRISEHDSLTGVMNRRAFLRVAEYLLRINERKSIPLVFIFADLDNFKVVNDQFGHDMGDKVLRHFSDMARSRFRESDIIARYGGDEFVIILTNTSLGSAELAVQGLQSEFRDWARNNGLQVGFSFGLEMVPEGRNNIDDVLQRVDAALYDAKLKRV